MVTCFQDLREKVEKHYGVITLVRCQPQTQFNVRGCQLKLFAFFPSYQTLLIQSRVYIILVQAHKSSFSQSIARRVLPVIVLLPCQDSLMMHNPICVSQPCSLTEGKKSRVGSVVMPYILSSTLRRMSTVSTLSNASSGLSGSSTSSDGPSCISSQESVPASSPCFLCTSPRVSVLSLCSCVTTFFIPSSFRIWTPLTSFFFVVVNVHLPASLSLSTSSLLSRPSDRRTSVLHHSEEDNRISRKNRKEWSVSKSQVLLERQSNVDEVRSMWSWRQSSRY